VSGGHHASVRIAKWDGSKGGSLVDDRSGDGGKVGGATSGVSSAIAMCDWDVLKGGPMALVLGDKAAIKQ
jgi:hypothetical protein